MGTRSEEAERDELLPALPPSCTARHWMELVCSLAFDSVA